MRDGLEACDGKDLGLATCAKATGHTGSTGVLACKADCTLDTSGCLGGPACGALEQAPSGGTCVAPSAACNPVTNASCDGAQGQACDYDPSGGAYKCYPPPNPQPTCAACDSQKGPFCAGGATCVDGLCARFCCSDADCGGGRCAPSPLGAFHVCVEPSGCFALRDQLPSLQSQLAPGTQAASPIVCGDLAEGAMLVRRVRLEPGKCYAAIGVASSGISALSVDLVTPPPLPPQSITSSQESGSPVVLGGGGNCFKVPTPIASDALLRLRVTKGSGTAVVELLAQ